MKSFTFTRVAMAATLTLGALTFSATQAQAQTGTISLEGEVRLQDTTPGGGGPDLLIDFLDGNPPVIASTPLGTVFSGAASTGVFAGVPFNTEGDIRDLIANAAGFTGTPLAQFIEIGGFTFTLDQASTGATFGPITLSGINIPGQGVNTFATFAVTGTVTGGTLAGPTRYTGVFTSQFAGQTPAQVFAAINSGGTLQTTFSAQIALTAIPEPSTYALLASGIGALALVARRRRTQA